MEELLDIVGLYSEHLDRIPSQLSGGELQRAAIVRVLVLQPAFIILDEPTSMLDTISQAQIIKLLTNVRKKMGIGYLFITHDPLLAEQFCHRRYTIQKGILS